MIRDSSIEWLCNSPDSVGVQDYRVLAEAYFVLRAELAGLVTAIDNELVTSGELGTFKLGDDPKAALNKLACWNQSVGAYFAARAAVPPEPPTRYTLIPEGATVRPDAASYVTPTEAVALLEQAQAENAALRDREREALDAHSRSVAALASVSRLTSLGGEVDEYDAVPRAVESEMGALRAEVARMAAALDEIDSELTDHGPPSSRAIRRIIRRAARSASGEPK